MNCLKLYIVFYIVEVEEIYYGLLSSYVKVNELFDVCGFGGTDENNLNFNEISIKFIKLRISN